MGAGGSEEWTSPSDLADYAYCPRSHWYRHHPPVREPTRSARASSSYGERYHERVLTAELARAERSSSYWVWVLVGLALAAIGVAWIYFRP